MPNPDNIKDKGFDKHPENINTGGYEKGVKNRSTIYRKWADVYVKIKDKANPTGKEVSGTIEDEMVLALISKGLKGDVQAIKDFFDSIYGKMPEKLGLEHSGSVTLPITGMQIVKDDTET